MNAPGQAQRDPGQRAIVTPEGIELHFAIAQSGDRAGAFLLDFVFMIGASLLLLLLVGLLGIGSGSGEWFLAFFIFTNFVICNGYFMFFELKWQGRTPGKRMVGIQVIDGHGGPLRPQAVVVRNLTRDLEVFLPLKLLLAPEMIWPGAPGWAQLAATLWVLVFALLPAFNRERLRVGDLLGGTRVVVAPKTALLDDIGDQRTFFGAPQGPKYTFTPDQLSHYGEYELSVLEQVLRQEHTVDPMTLEAVCRKIVMRIRWKGKMPADFERFLKDFYAAQRAQLERGMLFGERLADKDAARQRAKKSRPGA